MTPAPIPPGMAGLAQIKTFVRDRLPARWQVPAKHFYLHLRGGLERELDLLPLLVRQGERALDIGANYGTYAYRLARLGARIDFAILVEGRVAQGGEELCGGPVLDPVRTSRLDIPCVRHMLPAEDYPGRRFVLPPRNIQPLSVARPIPPGPYTERVFTTYFEFDRDFLVYQYDDFIVDNAVAWLRAAKPAKLVVTGFAATRPETVSGVTLAERPEVAAERAETIAETLRRLLPGLPVETRTQLDAQVNDGADADGIPGQSQRRAEIRAVF